MKPKSRFDIKVASTRKLEEKEEKDEEEVESAFGLVDHTNRAGSIVVHTDLV